MMSREQAMERARAVHMALIHAVEAAMGDRPYSAAIAIEATTAGIADALQAAYAEGERQGLVKELNELRSIAEFTEGAAVWYALFTARRDKQPEPTNGGPRR